MTTLGIPCVYQTSEVWMTSGPQAPPKCKPTVRISTEHAAGLFSFLQSKKASHFQNGQTLTVGLIACGRESFVWRATEMCVPLSPFLPQLSAEHPLAWNQLCLLSSIMDNSTESGWGVSTLSLTVTSVYFLPLPIALLWSESFPPASDEKVKSHRTSLPKVTQCSNVLPEPKPSALPLEQDDPLRIPSKRVSISKESHTDPAKDWLTAKLYFPAGYPPQKSSRETNFALSSNKRDEHLAKLFGRYPSHVKRSGCVCRISCLSMVVSQITCPCCSDEKESALPCG